MDDLAADLLNAGCATDVFKLTRCQLVFLWERLQRDFARKRFAYCNDTAAVVGLFAQEGGEQFKRHTDHLATMANGGEPPPPPADTYTPIEALLG